MSIDMFVTAAQSQASNVSAKCQANQEAYKHMIQAHNNSLMKTASIQLLTETLSNISALY